MNGAVSSPREFEYMIVYNKVIVIVIYVYSIYRDRLTVVCDL